MLKIAPLILVCGILGGMFAKISLYIMGIIGKKSLYTTLAVVFILGSIAAVLNYISGGLSSGSGHKEIIAMIYTSDAEMIKHIDNERLAEFFTTVEFGYEFVYMKFLATLSSMITSMPGGIFIPSISIGAGIGTFFADFFGSNYVLVIIMAMTAYLAAVIRMPITATLIILEMTGSLNLLIPALIIAFMSCYISGKVHEETLFHALSKKFDKLKH